MSLDPQVRMLHLMKQVHPQSRWKGNEPFEVWQDRARKTLKTLLGFPYEKADPRFRVEWSRQGEGYSEIRFLFFSEPEVEVVGQLLIPESEESKIPLVICLQGHSKGMHISLGRPKYPGDEETISGGDRDFARQIIARGQAALALEQRGFGERGGTPDGPACTQPAVQALLMGKTLLGQRCHDISCAIDIILEKYPVLDEKRIAVMGNSGGGTASIYAAALDTRISAAMPSCAFSGFLPSIGAQHHCLCNYIPGIMNEFDMGDLAGLIAPRPLVIVSGQGDQIFPIDSATEQAEIVKDCYQAAGAGPSFRHVIGSKGHRFYAELGWKAFDEVTHWRSPV